VQSNIANIRKPSNNACARSGHNPKGRGAFRAGRCRPPCRYSRYWLRRPSSPARKVLRSQSWNRVRHAERM